MKTQRQMAWLMVGWLMTAGAARAATFSGTFDYEKSNALVKVATATNPASPVRLDQVQALVLTNGLPTELEYGLISVTSNGTNYAYADTALLVTNGAPESVLATTNEPGLVRVSTADGAGSEVDTNTLCTVANLGAGYGWYPTPADDSGTNFTGNVNTNVILCAGCVSVNGVVLQNGTAATLSLSNILAHGNSSGTGIVLSAKDSNSSWGFWFVDGSGRTNTLRGVNGLLTAQKSGGATNSIAISTNAAGFVEVSNSDGTYSQIGTNTFTFGLLSIAGTNGMFYPLTGNPSGFVTQSVTNGLVKSNATGIVLNGGPVVATRIYTNATIDQSFIRSDGALVLGTNQPTAGTADLSGTAMLASNNLFTGQNVFTNALTWVSAMVGQNFADEGPCPECNDMWLPAGVIRNTNYSSAFLTWTNSTGRALIQDHDGLLGADFLLITGVNGTTILTGGRLDFLPDLSMFGIDNWSDGVTAFGGSFTELLPEVSPQLLPFNQRGRMLFNSDGRLGTISNFTFQAGLLQVPALRVASLQTTGNTLRARSAAISDYATFSSGLKPSRTNQFGVSFQGSSGSNYPDYMGPYAQATNTVVLGPEWTLEVNFIRQPSPNVDSNRWAVSGSGHEERWLTLTTPTWPPTNTISIFTDITADLPYVVLNGYTDINDFEYGLPHLLGTLVGAPPNTSNELTVALLSYKGGMLSLYQNGTLLESQYQPRDFSNVNFNVLVAANYADMESGGTNAIGHANGVVAGVRLSNIARHVGPDDVGYYADGCFENDANTLQLWKMNENTGTICYDSSGHSNNLVLRVTGGASPATRTNDLRACGDSAGVNLTGAFRSQGPFTFHSNTVFKATDGHYIEQILTNYGSGLYSNIFTDLGTLSP